jgi:hypothetical protein
MRLSFLIFLISPLALAQTTHNTRIHEIDLGRPNEEAIVLFEDGIVGKVSKKDPAILQELTVSYKNKTWLWIELSKKREVLSIGPGEEKHNDTANQGEGDEKELYYTPTVIPSPEAALKIYKDMNRKYNQESQCYNRAHVWSWEMYQKYHVRSNKTFVFFTPKYIRRYNFEWWFHVAPSVLIQEGASIVQKVMDYRYTRKPLTTKEWTNVFMHNNADCPMIEKYTDYEYTRSNADAPWCMVLQVPMYYYQPLDLEALAKKGKVRQFWEEWEVGNAYREAFNYRTDTNL